MDTETKKGVRSPPKNPNLVASINRASLARRTTRGPLDGDDPLGVETPPLTSSLPTLKIDDDRGSNLTSPITPNPSSLTAPLMNMEHPPKDFDYLLRPEIYRILPQNDVPQAFSDAQPDSSTKSIPDLLSAGHFRPAAIVAAQLLTSSTSSSDYTQIFSLLYVRLSCLVLINYTAIAAQEVKALEDLSSSYYRHPISNTHLVPWELRVLAVRLQGIGYADARRGTMGYYELARDARTEIGKTKDKGERDMWKARLSDLGMRVANALVEMGDLEAAARHLESLKASSRKDEEEQYLKARSALLYLRIGNLAMARRYIDPQGDLHFKSHYISALKPLLSMAEGDYSNAASQFSILKDEPRSTELNPLFTQNLAVCLLYDGKITEARSLLESMISCGHSFRTLVFNLSTIFELSTDRARSLKNTLAGKVAGREGAEDGTGFERGNGDFKL